MNTRRRTSHSKQMIRDKAERVLQNAGVSMPPVPVEQIAAFLGASVRYSPFEGELAGLLVRDDHSRVVIGVNSSHHPNRQRFTIAHECGHLLLHEGGTYVDKSFRVNLRDDISSMAIDPEEIEANRFAAELLMPYRMLLDDLRRHEIDFENEAAIQSLAKRYAVSLQAMTHRIANVLDNWIK